MGPGESPSDHVIQFSLIRLALATRSSFVVSQSSHKGNNLSASSDDERTHIDDITAHGPLYKQVVLACNTNSALAELAIHISDSKFKERTVAAAYIETMREVPRPKDVAAIRHVYAEASWKDVIPGTFSYPDDSLLASLVGGFESEEPVDAANLRLSSAVGSMTPSLKRKADTMASIPVGRPDRQVNPTFIDIIMGVAFQTYYIACLVAETKRHGTSPVAVMDATVRTFVDLEITHKVHRTWAGLVIIGFQFARVAYTDNSYTSSSTPT